jgi:hypothetical protein
MIYGFVLVITFDPQNRQKEYKIERSFITYKINKLLKIQCQVKINYNETKVDQNETNFFSIINAISFMKKISSTWMKLYFKRVK